VENNKPNRIHPLVAGAAISVMLASLTGIAALTGLIPNSHSSNNPVAATAEIPSTPSAAAPVASTTSTTANAIPPTALVDPKANTNEAPSKTTSAPQHPHVARTAKSTHSQPLASNDGNVTVAQAREICNTCGRVESVQAMQQVAKPSGLGVVAGAVLGGVLGNQVGNGNGRTLATVAGAVGGGYAGNEIEKRTHGNTTYQVRVRMEDGSIRTFPYSQQPTWNIGDRVRIIDGQLASRA